MTEVAGLDDSPREGSVSMMAA